MIEAWEEEQMSNLGCESVSDLIAEVKRLRKITDFVKSSIDFHYHSIDNNTGGFVNWMEFARELHLMLYGGDE